MKCQYCGDQMARYCDRWICSHCGYMTLIATTQARPWPMRAAGWIATLLVAPALLLALAAPARAQEKVIQSNLFLGSLTYLDHGGSGKFEVGPKLATLRLVMVLPLKWGIRLAARGDLTALGAIDPNAIDLSTSRTVEGYLAASWSRSIAGVSVGPAVMAGALVPTGDDFAWRYEPTYGAGLRLGRGRSWVYVLAGRDGASDASRATGSPSTTALRLILAGSVEFGRAAAVCDYVTGDHGRFRAGILVRIPNVLGLGGN